MSRWHKRTLFLWSALAFCLASGSARAQSELKAAYVTGDVLQPSSSAVWKSAAAVSLPLMFIDEPKWSYKVPDGTRSSAVPDGTAARAAGASSPEAQTAIGPAGSMTVKAIHNGTSIAFLLTWSDETQNIRSDATESFADGASIAFDAWGSCHMGSLANPTHVWNLWYWRAELVGAQNLLAAGMGSITLTPEKRISTLSSWTGTGWSVVFSRPLAASNPDNEVPLTSGNPAVRFSRWNGQQQERDGKKWITDSVKLTLRNRP